MAHLPIGDMQDRARAHGIRIDPVAPDQRGRTYLLTVFDQDDQPTPPTYSKELMHLLAWQPERSKRGFTHLQCYVVMRSRHTAAKTLRLLFPTGKNASTYIACAHRGTSHAAVLAYCAKPESRVPGTQPTVYGSLDEAVVKKEPCAANNLQNVMQAVQSQHSLQACFTHPATRKIAAARPSWTSQVWQGRPETLPPAAAKHPLKAWQRAVLLEVQAAPDDRILWIDVPEEAIVQALYLAKAMRCAQKDRVLLVDASEPRTGLFQKATEAKDIVVVTQLHGDATLSNSTLLHLKTGLCSASTPTGTANTLATFNPRHVLVLSTSRIPKASKLRPHIKTLDMADSAPVGSIGTLPPGEFVTFASPSDIAIQEATNRAEEASAKPTSESATDVDSPSSDDAQSEDGDSARKKAKT